MQFILRDSYKLYIGSVGSPYIAAQVSWNI